MKKALSQRQIPTVIGLFVLMASLLGGILLLGTGGGVFAPRATPQTTPKNVRITNIKDTSFTVSFLTDEATIGFIRYGSAANDVRTQASDDRDQLSGTVGQFTTHYITVDALTPGTEYFFTLGTGSVPKFDNNGEPFRVKTAPRGGNPGAAKTVYGTINTAAGTPADGAIVYLSIQGGSELSSLVRASGSWAVPLSTARSADLTQFLQAEDAAVGTLFVQGTSLSESAIQELPIKDMQPAPTITILAGDGSIPSAQLPQSVPTVSAPSTTASIDSSSPQGLSGVQTTQGTQFAQTTAPSTSSTDAALSGTATQSASSFATTTTNTASSVATTQRADIIDLSSTQIAVVETGKPTIVGKAAPNTVITIEVNSETKIVTQVRTDAEGNFSLPLAGGETALEPGEHTVTITYADPTTGNVVQQTRTFFVEAPAVAFAEVGGPSDSSSGTSTLLAQTNTLSASPSPSPFGSSNPFSISSPSATVSASASASPRVSMPATDSAVPKSGSVGTTLALVLGGIFLIALGSWSYLHQSHQIGSGEYARDDDDHSDAA